MSFRDSDGYIGVKKQAAFGTPLAPTIFTYVESCKIDQEQKIQRDGENGNTRYDITPIKLGHKVNASLGLRARPDILGFLLTMLLGDDTKSGGGAPYTHTIIPADPMLFFTLGRGINPATPTLIEWFQDCVVKDMSLKAVQGDILKTNITILGTKGTKQAAAEAPSYESDEPFMFYDGTFTVDGGASTDVADAEIKIDNGVYEWQGASMYPSLFIAQKLKIDIDFTLKFESVTQYAKIIYAAGTATSQAIATGSLVLSFTFGASTALRLFSITIPEIQYISQELDLGVTAGPLFQKCKGYATKGAGALVTAVVQNANSAAYDA